MSNHRIGEMKEDVYTEVTNLCIIGLTVNFWFQYWFWKSEYAKFFEMGRKLFPIML